MLRILFAFKINKYILLVKNEFKFQTYQIKGGQRKGTKYFRIFSFSFMSIALFTKIFKHNGTHIGIIERWHGLIELAK